jgi:D-threonate/D-erythronate kinase
MSGILILADDLTGANDTAIQFVKQGVSSLVIINADSANADLFGGYDVISVNCDSRRLNADEAYSAVYNIAKHFKAASFVYKKVDSALRGNPGQELAAVMDALDIPLGLTAPSFPANRSVIKSGFLSNGTNATLVFANGTGKKTENIPLEEIRKGADEVTAFIDSIGSIEGTQVFVADAVTDDDLEIIRKASTSLTRPHALAGSAGLANQLARNLGKTGAVPFRKPTALSPALIIAGTRQAETAAQIDALRETFPTAALVHFDVALAAGGNSEKAIAGAFDEASRRVKENPCSCVIAVDSMFRPSTDDYAEGDETSAVICEALGALAEKLMGSFRFQALLTTGGDTTLAVCHRLGVSAIEPLAEICPGIPLGRIVGGSYDGRFIVTKSGRFGNPGSLVEVVNWSMK